MTGFSISHERKIIISERNLSEHHMATMTSGRMNTHWVTPENIHTSLTEGIGI
jgi:hypothetical protein